MEHDIHGCTQSYLDEDDPFGKVTTFTRSPLKREIPHLLHDGNESGELTDDSLDVPLEKRREVDRMKRLERAREISSIWSSAIRPPSPVHSERRVCNMLDGIGMLDGRLSDLGSISPASSWGDTAGDAHFVPQGDEKMPPQVMRSRTNMLMAAGSTHLHSVPDRELRNLVKSASGLAHEHDQLLATREKLMSSMREIFENERATSVQLLKKMSESGLDEETRKLVVEMGQRIEALGEAQKAIDNEGPQPTHPLSVPFPNPSSGSVPPYGRPFSGSAPAFPIPPPNFNCPPPGAPDLSRPPPFMQNDGSPAQFPFPPPIPPPFPSMLAPPTFHHNSMMFNQNKHRHPSGLPPPPPFGFRPERPQLPVVIRPMNGDTFTPSRKSSRGRAFHRIDNKPKTSGGKKLEKAT